MAFNPSHCIRPFSSKSGGSARRLHRTSPFPSADPSSPKVGCMGQVRRCKSTSTVTLPQHPKHHDGRGLCFLMASAASLFVSPINRSRRPKAKKMQRVAERAARGADQVSLWKRRCRSGKLDELFFCKPERLPAVIAELVV
ncbi:hypothetical protein KSP39_PZI003398 [Platanthera zijinensis]|uniref:Uncharacterized protein n=1 Tax=Platanthera zijinensis TaxID=2320716 RepID=A0AAP0GC39_9ASPA